MADPIASAEPGQVAGGPVAELFKRLPLRRKFVVCGVVLVIPILLATAGSVSQSWDRMREVRRARAGADCVGSLLHLIGELGDARLAVARNETALSPIWCTSMWCVARCYECVMVWRVLLSRQTTAIRNRWHNSKSWPLRGSSYRRHPWCSLG